MINDHIETSEHLYNPPLYHTESGGWNRSLRETISHAGTNLSWNPAAIASLLSLGFVCGDMTLFKEIRRQPWLSEITPSGEPRLLPIPRHDTLWQPMPEIARQMGERLENEALQACEGRSEIYVLLSGGLDSRVVGAVMGKLMMQGRLKTKPIAVTWGLPDSRDVVYGQQIAKILGMEWIHVEMDPGVILHNIHWSAEYLGSMVYPVHQHRMGWFSQVSPDALVLAASYGDSVGRAEFSGKHLLELQPIKPSNPNGLISPSVYAQAEKDFQAELDALRARSTEQARYILCEHEMHGHYTRGLLGHAMNSVNNFCTVYQMFTHPDVYRYVWSLHPTLRFNDIYSELLEQLNPTLAHLPWARTNRSVKGPTSSSNANLRQKFQRYQDWISGPLYDQIKTQINLEQLASTGIFDMDRIRLLVEGAQNAPSAQLAYWFAWLASFQQLGQFAKQLGVHVAGVTQPQADAAFTQVPAARKPTGWVHRVRRRLERTMVLKQTVRSARRYLLKRRALRDYPPKLTPSDI